MYIMYIISKAIIEAQNTRIWRLMIELNVVLANVSAHVRLCSPTTVTKNIFSHKQLSRGRSRKKKTFLIFFI